jgi:hypothetical protein
MVEILIPVVTLALVIMAVFVKHRANQEKCQCGSGAKSKPGTIEKK